MVIVWLKSGSEREASELNDEEHGREEKGKLQPETFEGRKRIFGLLCESGEDGNSGVYFGKEASSGDKEGKR